MESKKLKTQMNLTKDQLEQILGGHLEKEEGLNEIFELLVNSLMKSERKAFLQGNTCTKNKANGYRNRTSAGLNTHLQLAIPRDRMGLFKPLLLGIMENQDIKIRDLCFSLYGKGLTTRQISEVIEGLYGEGYSKSTISRISEHYYEEIDCWKNRQLDKRYAVVMIDALFLNVRRHNTVAKEAFYVVMGLTSNRKREILAIDNLPTEGALGWQEVLENLRSRGLQAVELFVSDDLTGISESIAAVYPKANQQKCVIHLQRNLWKKVRLSDRSLFCQELKSIFDPGEKTTSSEVRLKQLKVCLRHWSTWYPSLKKVANRGDLSLFFTYFGYDVRVRSMLYTTNWIEGFNKQVKRVTKMRGAFPCPRSAMMLIGCVGMRMEAGAYNYPMWKFKFDRKLEGNVSC